MRRILLLSTLLLTGYSFAQTLQSANNKAENERYRDAINEFKKLIAADPINGENYFYYGDCYFEMEDLDSAKMMWRKGYEVDKVRALPIVGYGRVLWLEGKTTEAKAEFTKALLLAKKDKLKKAEVIRGIAEVYIEAPNKNLDEALILLEEAIIKDPKNEDNLLLKGDALYAKTPDNASLAIKSYLAVLDINPKSARGVVRRDRSADRVLPPRRQPAVHHRHHAVNGLGERKSPTVCACRFANFAGGNWRQPGGL